MKRAIFLDRDGTIIKEPETDFQVDSLEKLEFLPYVIQNLALLSQKLDYEWVMVSNQDGLGTESFPESDFWPAQNKMLKTLQNEGFEFTDICIDRSFEHENQPTRKPNTGMLEKYMTAEYDLEHSLVIGDRLTDIQLAKKLGAKGILISSRHSQADLENLSLEDTCLCISDNWNEIAENIMLLSKMVKFDRITKETRISIELSPFNFGKTKISTGIGFFDHMLEQIAHHTDIQIQLVALGDLQVDEHHTIEDTAITLGKAFNAMLQDKTGFHRYGFSLPMDDADAQVLIDFGGRSWFQWEAEFNREKIGDMPTELFEHFFKSFSDEAKCNLHIKANGKNEHHKIEAIFKAFARATKMALHYDPKSNQVPSTKGVL